MEQKKIVLVGGCFWVRNGMGPISQDHVSTFVNGVIKKGDMVYSSRREKALNFIYYV